MSRKNNKSEFSLTGLLIIALTKFCSFLPLRAAHAIGSGFGLLFYYLPNKAKQVAKINIEHCFPNLDVAQQNLLVKNSLKETGKTLTEMGAMWFWSSAKIQRYIQFENKELAINLFGKNQKPLMMLCPHLGCWEIVNFAISSFTPITSLYRPPRVKMIDKIMLQARRRGGGVLVPTSNTGVKALYRALRKKQVVGILPDQDPGEGKGIFAPFFGIPANTMPLAGRLISQTKPQVYLVYGERLKKGKGYKVIIKPAPDQILVSDQDRIATIINALVESGVRHIPEQYQWTYKRFKFQPDGSKFYAAMNQHK